MGKNNKQKTLDQFKTEVYDSVGNDFTVTSTEYKNVHTKIKFRHNICGNIIEITPTHFLNGTRCRYCSYNNLGLSRRHTTEEIRKLLKIKGYTLLSEYKTSNEKLTVKSDSCGHVFDSVFRNIYTGYTGCPICRLSKGENIINNYLSELGLTYKRQYRIPECRYRRALPFDFAIFKNNKMFLIEYNGIQHYSDKFRGTNSKDDLETIKKRDLIKKKYCENNNIPLLIIRYTEKNNIKDLITMFLNSTTRIEDSYTQVSGNAESPEMD